MKDHVMSGNIQMYPQHSVVVIYVLVQHHPTCVTGKDAEEFEWRLYMQEYSLKHKACEKPKSINISITITIYICNQMSESLNWAHYKQNIPKYSMYQYIYRTASRQLGYTNSAVHYIQIMQTLWSIYYVSPTQCYLWKDLEFI